MIFINFILSNIETIVSVIFIAISIGFNWYHNTEVKTTNRTIDVFMESSEEFIMMGSSYYLALVLARHNLSFSENSIIKNYEDLSAIIFVGILLNILFLFVNKKNNQSCSSCEEKQLLKKIIYVGINLILALTALVAPIIIITSFRI